MHGKSDLVLASLFPAPPPPPPSRTNWTRLVQLVLGAFAGARPGALRDTRHIMQGGNGPGPGRGAPPGRSATWTRRVPLVRRKGRDVSGQSGRGVRAGRGAPRAHDGEREVARCRLPHRLVDLPPRPARARQRAAPLPLRARGSDCSPGAPDRVAHPRPSPLAEGPARAWVWRRGGGAEGMSRFGPGAGGEGRAGRAPWRRPARRGASSP
jgi:hypothetical protein